MSEEALRYGWNYARLLAEGPSENALVPSPIMNSMRRAKSPVSKNLPVCPLMFRTRSSLCFPKKRCQCQLNTEVQARRGFNVIATANDRDRGINELSSALRRRFQAQRDCHCQPASQKR